MAAGTEKVSRVAAENSSALTPKNIAFAFAGLFLLNLLLRVFYIRYDFVNGDEAVRALTAARLLEGARLYAEVVTDKPPGATFFYAAVIALFGRSMKAVHLAAAIWNFATSMLLYLTASRLYSRRAGLWAALLFLYFSTNYLTQDMMAANTELLMALPYTASFYIFVKARILDPRKQAGALVAAGVLAGVATLFKQVGVFILAFFALYEAFAIYAALGDGGANKHGQFLRAARRAFANLLTVAAGFAAVLSSFALWLFANGALDDFWRNAIVLGRYYVNSLPTDLWLRFLGQRAVSYILFNAALWSLALWPVVLYRTHKRMGQAAGKTAEADLAIALWGAASLSAVFAGGRFYGHYFLQVLPALSLLASRGIELLGERLKNPLTRRNARIATAALAVLFSISFVRFHQRTAVLAYETFTGARTEASESWGMTRRESEAEVIARYVRRFVGPGEPLYIWDYALDVYWRTGCRPASRYLTPYYIDGKFPDAEVVVASPEDPFWREARAHLIEDLRSAQPRLILDVFGSLQELPYPELTGFIQENYRYKESIGLDSWRPFLVFELKDAEDRLEK